MKNWFWIPLAAIVGGIAGSWGPREDLARSVRHLAPVSGGNRQTNLADLEKFCTHIAFVRDGKVVQTAALADLTADGSSLEDKYLIQFKT